ncbi:MAG: Rrf2 family transcriptional regulator [Aestuariivirga sp.]|uniref:RrF2 family transcriptional regulator n=1 Tax=Aestuariivirga sp. TaxID=2650926 RepID=UPI00301AD7E5
MRLSVFTDYSLRVLIQAALRHPNKVTIDEVANAFGISRNHLIKVINKLGRAGFLVTQRGRSDGFMLARPAERISILDVVRFGEEDQPLVECFDAARNRCVITPACKLKGMIAEANRAFFDVLGKYTIADASANPEPLFRHLELTESCTCHAEIARLGSRRGPAPQPHLACMRHLPLA